MNSEESYYEHLVRTTPTEDDEETLAKKFAFKLIMMQNCLKLQDDDSVLEYE